MYCIMSFVSPAAKELNFRGTLIIVSYQCTYTALNFFHNFFPSTAPGGGSSSSPTVAIVGGALGGVMVISAVIITALVLIFVVSDVNKICNVTCYT